MSPKGMIFLTFWTKIFETECLQISWEIDPLKTWISFGVIKKIKKIALELESSSTIDLDYMINWSSINMVSYYSIKS